MPRWRRPGPVPVSGRRQLGGPQSRQTHLPCSNLLPGFAYGGTPQRLGLMVMIVKEHEKKARGFISVTRVTTPAHVSALRRFLPRPVMLVWAATPAAVPGVSRVPAGLGWADG